MRPTADLEINKGYQIDLVAVSVVQELIHVSYLKFGRFV
jgi:hypothetical protein